jgi:hypothetical protein
LSYCLLICLTLPLQQHNFWKKTNKR